MAYSSTPLLPSAHHRVIKRNVHPLIAKHGSAFNAGRYLLMALGALYLLSTLRSLTDSAPTLRTTNLAREVDWAALDVAARQSQLQVSPLDAQASTISVDQPLPPAAPVIGPQPSVQISATVAPVSTQIAPYLQLQQVFDQYTTLHSAILQQTPLPPDYISVSQLVKQYARSNGFTLPNSNAQAGQIPKRRYIVAEPAAQLNNRLRVIVTAIVLGLLTDRAVLCDFTTGYYAGLNDLFDHPLLNSMQLTANNRPSAELRSTVIRMEDMDSLLCSDINAIDSPYGLSDVLTLPSLPSLVPFLWRNPHTHTVLRHLLTTEESIYRTVAHAFLVPSPTVQQMVDTYTQQYFANARHRVGVHLRWGQDHRPQPVLESEWTDMINCVVQALPAANEHDSDDVVIFLAADTAATRERATTLLRNAVQSKQLTVLTYGDFKVSNTAEGVQAAFTELLLLSSCDTLVLTPQSSFGEQAMALSGVQAFYVRSDVPNAAQITYNQQHMHTVADRCLRSITTQPSIAGFNDMIASATCYHASMWTKQF